MSDKMAFVVTSGSYSEYSVHSMFSTREGAERYVATLKQGSSRLDDVRIEEWVLDADVEARVLHMVFFDSRQVDATRGLDGYNSFNMTIVDVPTPAQVDVWDDGTIRGTGFGTSPELARKALQDAVAQAKAERAGL